MTNRAYMSLPDRCDLRMRLADPVGESVTEANRILDVTEPRGLVLAPLCATFVNSPNQEWNGHTYAGVLDPAFRRECEALTLALQWLTDDEVDFQGTLEALQKR